MTCNPTQSERNAAWANFHFRMVEVAMMLLLPLLALALAIPPKRSTSALGVFLSIVMVVTYHKINEYAESLGALGTGASPCRSHYGCRSASPLPRLIFWMYHVIAHVPGGQPIGALEVFAAKAGKAIKKLFRFGRRKSRLLAQEGRRCGCNSSRRAKSAGIWRGCSWCAPLPCC
jgi:lipopolysaccharide export system permease protein